MPFENFNDRHFSPDEANAVQTALNALEDALKDHLANLSPDERQQYGSINEQNKLIVNKVMDFYAAQPSLASPDVDWSEYQADYNSRQVIEQTITRLQSLILGLGNAKILHDYDNYQMALRDYQYTKYKVSTSTPGFEAKYNEIKQFFRGGGTIEPSEP